MLFSPLEHQHLAIDHMHEKDIALLFAGMGLGKTASTLEAFNRRFLDGDCKGVLIVAPLRVAVLTWPDEVKKWANFSWMRVANLRTKEGKRAWENGDAEIYCINYEALPTFSKNHIHGKRAAQMPVDAVVFDEISVAKNPQSKRINAFRKYIPKFRIRQGLTGTPLPNSHLDLFAQVRLVDEGERFGKFSTHYRKTYFRPENEYSDFPKYVLRDGAKEIIEEKLSDIALTLLSKDWLKIPPTELIDVPTTMNKKARETYQRLEEELIVLLSNGEKLKAVNLAVLAGKLLQITGGACYKTDEDDNATQEVETLHDSKIKALAKLYKDEGEEPILIACQYRHEIERVKKELGAIEFSEENLPKWNEGKIPMMVAHPKSISHGLNLQHGGRIIVWYSLSYSRETYDQFNARLARTGQQHITKIFRLICPGTIDDAVAGVLHNKGANQSAFLDAMNNVQRLLGNAPANANIDMAGFDEDDFTV